MKVKQAFTDRDTGMAYAVGEVYRGTADRVAELRESGHLTKTDTASESEPEAEVPAAEPAPTRRK